MLEEIHFFIKEKKLIQKNDKILIALSGGPDSVALFYILQGLKKEYSLDLGVAHINHCLRADNADADEEFVINLAEKYKTKSYIKKIDLKSYAKENKIGIEEAGRKIRYDFFEELANKYSYDKIALGHNLDDNIETFLFRLMRGTSIEGLNSIPVNRGKIIRPLMKQKKINILNYLRENKYEFRIDESNMENIYTRNKIRLDLIPYIEKEFNPNFLNSISNLIDEIKDVNSHIKSQLSDFNLEKSLDLIELKKKKSFIRKFIYKEFLKVYNIEINRAKFNNIDEIIFSKGSKQIDLSEKHMLIKDYNSLYVKEKKIEYIQKNKILLEINNKIRYNNYEIKIELVNNVIKEKNVFNFDYDKMSKNIFVRTRESGDKFVPKGMSSHKKLKKFFIDEKIPKEERDKIPIIVSEKEIILVANLRASNLFKVDKNTKKILLLKVKEV